MRLNYMLLGSAIALPLASAALAAPVTVLNASFEEGVVYSEGGYEHSDVRPIVGWAASGGRYAGRWNPTNADYSGQDGPNHVAYSYGGTSGDQPYANGNILGQTLGINVAANTRYTLMVDVGNTFQLGDFAYFFGLIAGDMSVVTPGDTVLASTFGTDVTEGAFRTISLVYETGANVTGLGQPLSIFLSNRGAFSFISAAYDNVRLDATSLAPVETPEPAALALLCFGMVGIAATRRRAAIRP